MQNAAHWQAHATGSATGTGSASPLALPLAVALPPGSATVPLALAQTWNFKLNLKEIDSELPPGPPADGRTGGLQLQVELTTTKSLR